MKVTIEEGIYLRDIQMIIADFAFLLSVHHKANDFVHLICHQVVFGKDI